MGIIQNQKIGLRIAGTKSRQSGFAPLVAVGILAGDEGNNMDKVTLVTEKNVYIIKHTNDYILYQLIDRKVKPCDRDTIGILSIALTIARDTQLADGKSPYSLLKEVYQEFVDNYMERGSDGIDSFIDKDIDQSVFVLLLEKYPTESRSSRYIPMNPKGMSGILRVQQDKMDELFRDSQYPEFASFKEIEIGLDCSMTMPELEKIEIPRPKKYSVIVNKKDTGCLMSKATDTFDTATATRFQDTSDITYDHISFSLSDLFTSPDNRIEQGNSSVVLDTVRDCIICNIYSKKNTYMLGIVIRNEGGTPNDGQVIEEKIKKCNIKLTIDGNVINNKEEVPASFARKKVEISPNYIPNLGFLTVDKLVVEEGQLKVVIVYKKGQTVDGTITIPNNGYHNKKNATHQQGSKNVNQSNDTQKDDKSNTDNINNETSTRKKRGYKKLIFLLVGLLLGMCIGFGSWGIHSITTGQITQQQLIDAQKAAVKDANEAVKDANEAVAKANEAVEKANGAVKIQEAKDAAAKAERDKEEAAKKLQAAKKEETKAEILNLVNKKNLEACRAHWGWKKYLTQRERYAVEAVLNINQYRGVVKKNVENYLTDKTVFKNWDELMAVKREIEKIQNAGETGGK